MNSPSRQIFCDSFIVSWFTGGVSKFFNQSVVSLLDSELKAGDVITVRRNGKDERATILECQKREILVPREIVSEGEEEHSEGQKEPGPSAHEPGSSAQEPGPSAQEPGPSAQEPGPSAQEPGSLAQEPGPSAQEPGPSAQEPGPSAQEPAPSAQEPGPSAQTMETDDNDKWVPIGSGTTRILKDQYNKINWKSYMMATRKLLMAVFSRETLATHTMSGKKSPAFPGKPAKKCLDPTKVSDVVIEVRERFNVPENGIRNVIGIKCADECKMWKARLRKNRREEKSSRLFRKK